MRINSREEGLVFRGWKRGERGERKGATIDLDFYHSPSVVATGGESSDCAYLGNGWVETEP